MRIELHCTCPNVKWAFALMEGHTDLRWLQSWRLREAMGDPAIRISAAWRIWSTFLCQCPGWTICKHFEASPCTSSGVTSSPMPLPRTVLFEGGCCWERCLILTPFFSCFFWNKFMFLLEVGEEIYKPVCQLIRYEFCTSHVWRLHTWHLRMWRRAKSNFW